jgi:hypothetical protein
MNSLLLLGVEKAVLEAGRPANLDSLGSIHYARVTCEKQLILPPRASPSATLCRAAGPVAAGKKKRPLQGRF